MPGLVWFRRDLRIEDHSALGRALRAHDRVFCVFIFDTDILASLHTRAHRRVEFLHGSLVELDRALRESGGGLIVRHGHAHEEVPRLAIELGAKVVYVNRDYEPRAIARDQSVREALGTVGVAFRSSKDQVIFERDEVLTKTGGFFSVFTPYRSAWMRRFSAGDPGAEAEISNEGLPGRLRVPDGEAVPSLATIGYATAGIEALGVRPGASGARALFDDFKRRIDRYDARRDYPAVKGPSYLSVHLRFGTISIRSLVGFASARKSSGASTWLSELIWREFYFMILAAHPHVVDHAFRPQFDAIRWENDEHRYAAWCEGRTGYPIVDAAMRQMNRSGYMHNRLRMIVASFLTKHLGIDWRWGERYFARELIDYDLAANNGGWQWAASTGSDAQPYFRIFNPMSQSARFDADGAFIRRYVPELAGVPAPFVHAPWRMSAADQRACGCVIGRDYPAPIVEHEQARKAALARFGEIKGTGR